MAKKILITGANGLIASLVRPLFIDDSVVLVSRRPIDNINQNELSIIYKDISSIDWRDDSNIGSNFDMILHFAEYMSGSVKLVTAVDSHLSFLNWACKISSIVVYPLTAYLYDRKKQHSNYVKIKQAVMEKMIDHESMYFPVIHPLVDAGPGLHRQKAFVRKYAPLNLLSSFNAKMYVLSRNDINCIIPTITNKNRFYDVFSQHLSIAEIFASDKKETINWISDLLFYICLVTPFTNTRDLLVDGRNIQRLPMYEHDDGNSTFGVD